MKGFKILLMLVLTTAVVIWLDTKINVYDLNYYQGKDNGFSVRFYSICILSPLFFVLMGRRKRGLLSAIGLFVAILSIIVSYFIWFMLFEDSGVIGKQQCTVFGNQECTTFGNKSAQKMATRMHNG